MIFANSMREKDGGEFPVADIRGWGHLQYVPRGEEIQDANGLLIAAAPELLEALKDAYLKIQTLVTADVQNGNVKLAVETDSLRAFMRNTISKATGEDCEAVQVNNEREAFNKADGNPIEG